MGSDATEAGLDLLHVLRVQAVVRGHLGNPRAAAPAVLGGKRPALGLPHPRKLHNLDRGQARDELTEHREITRHDKPQLLRLGERLDVRPRRASLVHHRRGVVVQSRGGSDAERGDHAAVHELLPRLHVTLHPPLHGTPVYGGDGQRQHRALRVVLGHQPRGLAGVREHHDELSLNLVRRLHRRGGERLLLQVHVHLELL